MDLDRLADPFPEADVEWRVQTSGTNSGRPWARVLAYITARAIMSRLDDVCGPLGWKVSYRHVKEKGVICELSIWDDEKAQWITKEDGAEETDIESMKGGLSSALKRAGACLGIGRYLYQLEAGFADCVTQKDKAHPHYAKTKDGTAFYWSPPALPSWALPSGDGSPKPAAKPKPRPKKAEDDQSDIILSDAQLKKIGILRRELELPDAAYRKGLVEYYGTGSTRNLTREQAGDLIERLEARQRAKLADEGAEAFGGDGRLGKLRAQAFGYCDTMGRHGLKYVSGEPVDFGVFGLPGGTLDELRELIGCIEDEKELEGVIVKLEKVLENMSF